VCGGEKTEDELLGCPGHELLAPGSPAIFQGLSGLALTDVPPVSQSFSVAISFTQKPGTSGYLFAKHAADQPRLYSVFLSTGEEGGTAELVFLYTAVGVGAGEGVTATARFPLTVRSHLADGKPHQLLLVVGGTGVSVRIDGSAPASHRLLGASVADCSASDDASCTLSIGAATTDSFLFEG
jgi:hypothetical protein